METVLEICCDLCEMQGTSHCRDCVVQVLLEPKPQDQSVVVDLDEQRAMRELSRVGLIPEIRMKARKRSA